MIKEKSCGAVVFRKNGKEILYLLLYRKAHDHYKDSWDFPRGLMEEGETEEETTIRETLEETAINDLKFEKGFLERIKWVYKKEGAFVSKEVVYHLGETNSSEVKLSHEHDDFRWCNFEEALKLIKFSNTKSILKKANEFLV